MKEKCSIRSVQDKILEIMIFIDSICRKYNIEYFIMGGTALGAIRHGGFIPWDDDLDIFMTPKSYEIFRKTFTEIKSEKFILQEWKVVDDYLEYAKVRMNGTTFIENNFKGRKDIHQGIYVDIMILHKISTNKFIQRIIYLESKFVTLYALSQRNWKPKSLFQKIALMLLKLTPKKAIAKKCYKHIYRYDLINLEDYKYCYWITPASFKRGLFDKDLFEGHIDVTFENVTLMAPKDIEKYLVLRYGNFMEMPSAEKQKASVHALFYDCNVDYKEYLD